LTTIGDFSILLVSKLNDGLICAQSKQIINNISTTNPENPKILANRGSDKKDISTLPTMWLLLFLTLTIWAQTDQTSTLDDLKAQIDTFNTGNSDMTITIGADFDISSPLEINNNGYTLTLQSLVATPHKLTRAASGNLITIKKGTLTLQNIVIDGNKDNTAYANARGSLVFVGDGGVLNMLDGTTLQNNASGDFNGSGVYVDGRGLFNMSGGLITGNKTNFSGGGVYIYALRATFNMSGGLITNDTCGTSATSYSGGVHFANTPFATDTDPDKTPSVFRVGGVAVIKDNAKGGGSTSNVYMAGSRYITLGDGTSGVPPPTGGMEVWITKVAEHGLFVNKGAKPPNPPSDQFGDAKYFQADAGSQIYYLEVGKLAMEAGYDISLNPEYLKFMEISGYAAQPSREITVTNIGGKIGALKIYFSGEQADDFELDLSQVSNIGMNQYETQTFTVRPKLGLDVGTYSAFVLVSAPEDVDGGGPVIMRRLDVEFLVREYVEDRTLYFNQSDGKFYASSTYTELGELPSPDIFVPENEIRIPASWNSETNTLKIFGVDWTTTAPYALYFCQPTPVSLELSGYNSFASDSIGVVSRSNLTLVGDSLEAKGKSYGLFSKALTINSGLLIASGDTVAVKLEKDIVLRAPPEIYIYDPTYQSIKIKVPPPDYEIAASVDNNEPFVNTNVEISLTVKDLSTGEIYSSIDGARSIDLKGIPSADFEITSGSLSSVQFDNGVGKIDMKLKKTGAQTLWFSMGHPDYPAINPIVITPLPNAPQPDISVHTDSLTFPDTTYGYPTQPPLNVIVENKNTDGHPTGELTVKIGGADSTSFTISNNKVATIPAGGSATLNIAPVPGLDAKTHSAILIVSGNRIAEDKEVAVNFKVGKAQGAKVATPAMANETASSIFIYSIPKPSNGQEVEYAISETKTPETYNFATFGSTLNMLEFPNVKEKTYYIFARTKENANYQAGEISEPLESCVPFNKIALSLWNNNTLTVINNPANNSLNSTFTNFIWYRNDQEVGRGQSFSEDANGGQLQSGKYHVEMQSKDGKIFSCKYEVTNPPAPKKQPTKKLEIYTVSGKRLDNLNESLYNILVNKK